MSGEVKLVPVEPTEEMIEAACKLSGEDGMRGSMVRTLVRRDYQAMLSAAPSPNASGMGGEVESIAADIRALCNGHPHAKIAWPHRELHDLADRVLSLRTQPDRPAEGEEAVAWTGSGSMRQLATGGEGHIWSYKSESHPIPLYTRPATAEAERDGLDAARYRWLRDGNAYAPEEELVRGGEALDILCDQALAALKERA